MHTAVVLDINSGSVGGGVVLLRKRLPPALLYSFRKNFRVSSPLRSSMRRALDQVLRQMYNDGLVTLAKNGKVPRKVDHILVTLSSVWDEADLNVIEEEITKVLGSKRGICVKDFLFVLSHTLNLRDKKDVLIASVSGDFTEFIPVSEMGERRPKSVQAGPEIIAKEIADELKLEPHLASSLVSLYSQNVLDPNKKDEVEPIVAREMEKWRDLVFDSRTAQKMKRIHLFASHPCSGIAGRIFKNAYPGVEIVFEERDPLELLSAFSNSLL